MAGNPRFKPDWGQVWSDVVMKDAPEAALGSVLLAAAGGAAGRRGSKRKWRSRSGSSAGPGSDAVERLYVGADPTDSGSGELG
jgi:hypothetical protein